jgi:2-haloacid dehalogenase
MLDALLRHAGILEMFASVISVDAARSYKPDPACYALVGRELGLSPPEVLFVSSNGFDVAGAKAYGFEVAWIERGGAAADLFSMQRSGAETCGPPADHRIGALTDLAGLLGPAA